jgi:hypothetical protein
MQIIAAFSMILGVLNLIRVNGDKIYKKRKNWFFSILIIVSLFSTLIVGFANIGGELMYDRKILKTNTTVIGNITKDVMLQNGFKITDKDFGLLFKALVDATQKEKVISSILPDSLKTGEMRGKFDKMLPLVRKRSENSIKIVNNLGRTVNQELKSSLKKLDSKSFNESIIKVYDDIKNNISENNKIFALKNQALIEDDIEAQLTFLFKNIKTVNPPFKMYKDIKVFINEFNNFLINDENVFNQLSSNLASANNYNDFYKKSAILISLKTTNSLNKFLLENIIDAYLNNIYTLKNKYTKETLISLIDNTINTSLSQNKELINKLKAHIEKDLTKTYTKDFKVFVKNSNDYIAGNKYIITSSISETVYSSVVSKLYLTEKKDIASLISKTVKSPALFKELERNKNILADIISNSQKQVEALGISKESSKFVMNKLIEGGGEYKLYTLDNGSSFMEIYRYIFTPLSSTMFALLAFFVASASYRAFRARNKEATLLLISGFLVMLGAVPIGEILSIPGVFSVAEVSDFIMNVPVMSVQSGIMIGVALGVISTSLRLILGIERSHLGGD